MFWSGNYIAVRELKFLLKEVNVSLTQVLEADDILQECKADNNALIQFLTKPHILAELITLITEEPPKNVELANQYRHANIACEVLTSHLSTLSDRLSLDSVQMNRLCDFINREPPLNPLLASFFSKTVEMLLIRNPKQDWYLYHIVCLRVLDFFKSRRDFLPNLLRHISTSAIADVFKYFIRLDDVFNKIVMEWLDEYQFLESLIQIVCGTYVPEELPQGDDETYQQQAEKVPEQRQHEDNDRLVLMNHNQVDANGNTCDPPVEPEVDNAEVVRAREQAAIEKEELQRRKRERMAAVASANAAALLCELVLTGCAPEGCSARSRSSWSLVRRIRSAEGVGALLQGVFTSPARARTYALVHGCTLLRALLMQNTQQADGEEDESCVELAVGPHLPLLHHALLHDPDHYLRQEEAQAGGAGEDAGRGDVGVAGRGESRRVGAARVQVAALLAQLALCPVEEVSSTMLTLGTPGVLIDMFFSYPNNNFLHGEVHSLVKHSLLNAAFRTQYARHLIVECDLLTRLMDVFAENENKKEGAVRSGYMGHVVLMLKKLAKALEPTEGELAHQLSLEPALLERWSRFLERKLQPLLEQHGTPLGGYYPSSNTYEADDMTSIEMAALDGLPDINTGDINDMCDAAGPSDAPDFVADCLGIEHDQKMAASESHFMQVVSQRFSDDMWDDAPDPDLEEAEPEAGPSVRTVLEGASPWDSPFVDSEDAGAGGGGAGSGEGWAQFIAEAFSQPAVDPFAPLAAGASAPPPPPHPQVGVDAAFPGEDDFGSSRDAQFTPYWAADADGNMSGLEADMQRLGLQSEDARSVNLANNLLTAMSGMSPDAIADIVNATLDQRYPSPDPAPAVPAPAVPAPAVPAPAVPEPVPADPAARGDGDRAER